MAVEAVTVSVDQPYSESWDIRSVAGLGDPERAVIPWFS